MIYVNIKGGLGNQIYQGGFAVLLEIITGQEVRFLTHSYQNYTYEFKYELNKNFPHFAKKEIHSSDVPPDIQSIHEPYDGFDPKVLFQQIIEAARENKSIVLDGYWGDEAYWEQYVNIYKEIISPRPDDEFLVEAGSKIKSMDFIGIHVRRSDYGHHGIAQMDYYRNSLKEIRRVHGELPALVFTDEYNVCVFEFSGIPNLEVVRGDKENPIVDFYTLSCCKHFILSNSTFSILSAIVGETSESMVFVPYPLCTFTRGKLNESREKKWHVVEGVVRKA